MPPLWLRVGGGGDIYTAVIMREPPGVNETLTIGENESRRLRDATRWPLILGEPRGTRPLPSQNASSCLFSAP